MFILSKKTLFLKTMRQIIIKFGPFITIGVLLFMLGALHFGWLNMFFFGAEKAQVQGIDYFAVPKSFLNLTEGRSAFDTWGGTPYGPYATWYLAHPAFSVFVAGWFSFFSPWISYWVFTLFSVIIMFLATWTISRQTDDRFTKNILYFTFLCAFPTFWMLYVGNMHAPLILALSLIFVGVYELTYSDPEAGSKKLFWGLLLSFFTKPIVLLMLPVLLLVKETRRATLKGLLIYALVSLLFIIVPFLNPQSIGWNKMLDVMFDFDFIKSNMNIFKNNFVLNEYMKDNSIHWLNLIAQSDHKLMHIDVFSLPVFIDTLLGHEVRSTFFKLPIYFCLLVSFLLPFVEDQKLRLESLLLLLVTISLTFFLSYNTVWEYQYASILPVLGIFLVLKKRNVFYSKMLNLFVLMCLIVCLPSLYFLVRAGDLNSAASLSLIRLTRVLPVLIIFLVSAYQLVLVLRKNIRSVKPSFPKVEKLFFD